MLSLAEAQLLLWLGVEMTPLKIKPNIGFVSNHPCIVTRWEELSITVALRQTVQG
jgi:hypothetical protein